MVTLQNEFLTAKIHETGAELKSLVYRGTEYIWEGRDEVWGNSGPLLFPICGGLKQDKYVFEGKEYQLEKHGYIRHLPFTVENATAQSATFSHRSDAETRKHFPFDYELYVTYTLDGMALKVEYRVVNKSDKTMYFSIGSHEGYYTPESIEDYDVIFPEKETLDSYVLYGNLLSDQRLPILKDSNVLPLYDKYFTIDALVFRDLKSRSATLRNRKTGRAIRVDFPGCDYFLLWHKAGAPYICLEPWHGVQDRTESSYDITEKEGIKTLPQGETFRSEHVITVVE